MISTSVSIECREQDLNLRTPRDWDLNPAPLTKLGYPCAGRARVHTMKMILYLNAFNMRST